ncbi:MAG: class I SAM-dependent methyltransferase [Treponema sp.]|nr:class I SAM-dependent methyltransferase [Treponema sp.]
MDLHDFDDVAQNYDLYLGEMYKEKDMYEGFQDFYLELAKKYGKDGVIDIACGTGAVLLNLAKNGIDVDGSDLSEAMVNVCSKKAATKNLKTRVFAGNMTNFKSDRKYSLAIIARSGFMHLLSGEDQRKTLLNIREHLTDGGILTLNTFQPFPIIQAAQMQSSLEDYRFRLEYTNKDGLKEKIYCSETYDYISQVMTGNWKFETYDNNGKIISERIRPLKMRHTYISELTYLAELCGFEVMARYGDYYKSTEETGRYTWILKKI